MTAYHVTGDVRAVLAKMPDASVDLVMTSPPFLALRSYLPDDDPAKVDEIGSEANPGEFIDALLDVTEELHRVLTPTGSLCVELGDTYAGSGGAGGDYGEDGWRAGQPKFRAGTPRWDGRPAGQVRTTTSDPAEIQPRSRSGWHRLGAREFQPDQPEHYRRPGSVADSGSPNFGDGWPTDKSLCGIPELYRLSLIYGRNLLTGRPTLPWRVRNVVRWCRPNPPVGALSDKFRPATSEVVIAAKTDEAGRRRFFDGDAVRTKHLEPGRVFAAKLDHNPTHGEPLDRPFEQNPIGAPLLDWWAIPTKPYRGSHYATFSPRLVAPIVKAMSPLKVCLMCGEPSRRIVKATEGYEDHLGTTWADRREDNGTQHSAQPTDGSRSIRSAEYATVGFTDCGHNAWRQGRVLDPFGGSGTTAAVATGMGRDAILIDLDRRNVELARERVGPMFFVEVDADELRMDLEGRV